MLAVYQEVLNVLQCIKQVDLQKDALHLAQLTAVFTQAVWAHCAQRRPGLEYTIECDLLRQNSFTMRLSCLPSTNTVFQKQIQTVVNTLQKFIRLQHTQGGPLDSLKQFVQEQVATREEPLFLTVEATEVIDEMDGYCSPVEVTSGPPPTDNVVATIDNPFYENDDGVCGQNKYMQGYACFYCNDVSQMRKGSSPAQLQNSFPRRVDLRLHIEKKHMQTINGKIGLDCPVCPRKFRSKTAVDPKRTTNLVLQHVREAHNLQYMPEQSIENAYKQSNIPCYYCSDVCENVPQLKAHLQENHVTKKDGRYTLTCTLCKNEYNTAQLNNTHYIVQLLFKHMFNKHFTKDSTRKDSISKNSQRTNVNSKPTLNESSTDQSVVVGNVPHVMDANPSYQGSSGSTPQTLQPSFGSQTLVNGPLHFQSPLMLGGDLNIGDPFTNVCDVQLPFANACNLHPPSVGTQSSAPILRTIRMKEEVPSLITQMGSQQQVTFLLVKDPPVKNDDESQNSEEQNTKWFSDENADATCQENSMDGYICFFCNDERLINKSRTMPVPVRHSYKSKIDLRLHIQAKHMTIIEEELAISCPLCPRTFRSKVTTQPKRMMNKFFQHVRDDHDVKYMPTVSLDNACKRSNIQCYYCDEISDNCTLFTTHLKENHVVVDNGKHSMICPLCAKDYSTTQANKTFHIAQLLTRHMFYKHELGGKSLSVDDGGGDSAAHDFATDPNSSAPNMQHSLVENRKDEDMDNSSLNHTNGTHGGNWITQEIATNESYYCFFCTSLPEGTPSSTRHCKPLDSLDCLKKHIRSFHIKQRTCNSSIECPMCLRTVSCNSKGDQEHMVDYIISHVCLCHSYTRNAVLSGMVKNKDHQYVTTEQEHGCHASPKTQVVASTHSCFCFFCNDAMSMIRLKDPRCLKNPLGNRGELKKHIMEAHVTDLAEIPAITCPVCQSVFSCIHEENLLNRYLNHVMEKHGLVFEYVCDGVLSDSNSSFCSLINSQRESRDLEYTGPSKGVFETRNHDSEATTEQKPVLCIFCGLTCHGGDQLIQHIVEGHVTQLTGRISLMCPVCDQVLQSPKEPNELVHRLLLHLDKDHQVRPQGSDSVVIRGRIPTPGKGHINVSLGHASGGEDGAVFDLSHGNQASDKEHREASSQDNNRPTHHTYHCIFCEQALLAVRGVELYQPEARFASIDQLCKHIATTHVEGRSTKQWLPCPFNGGCKLVANRCGPYTLAAAALEHITDAHHVQFSVYQHPEESGHLVAGSDTEIQLCNNTKLFQCNTNVCVICAMGRESSGSDQTALMDVEIVAADVVFDCEENLKKHLTLHHTSESSEDSETSRAIECPICSRSIIAYRANGDVACDFLNHIKDVHFLYYQSDVCMALLKESWVVGKTVQSNCVFVIDDWEQLETSFSDFIDDHKNINLDTTCEACQDSTNDFSFSTLQELVDHLLENHRGLLTEDVESLKCPFCPWILAWQISDDPNYSSCAKHFVNHLAIQHCSIEKEGMLEEPRPTSTSGNRAPRSSPSRMDYYCFFCLGSEQRFSVLEDLKEHMLTHVASHSGLESIISCPSCDFRVIRGKEQFRPGGPSEAVLQILAEHMLLKHQHPAPHWIPMLRCKLCGWDTLVRTSLIQHYRQLHFKDKPPKPRNTCPHCTKQLNTEQELNDHIQAAHMRREKVVDGKKKTATCDMCGRLFCDERSRIQHAWLKHKVNQTGGEMIMCESCGDFVPKSLVRVHGCRAVRSKPQNRTQCDLCGAEFGVKYLSIHLARIHGVNCHECALCEYVTTSEDRLENHVESCHPGGATSQLVCQQCDNRRFYSKVSYENHIYVRHHRNISARQEVSCEICGFITLGNSLLRSHMKCHDDSKLKCKTCSKTLPSLRALKIHNYTHRKGRDTSMWTCDRCHKSLSGQAALMRHKARCTGGGKPKRLRCRKCSYSCYTKVYFRDHMRLRHGVIPEDQERHIVDVIPTLPMKSRQQVLLQAADEVVSAAVSLTDTAGMASRSQLSDTSSDVNVDVIADVTTANNEIVVYDAMDTLDAPAMAATAVTSATANQTMRMSRDRMSTAINTNNEHFIIMADPNQLDSMPGVPMDEELVIVDHNFIPNALSSSPIEVQDAYGNVVLVETSEQQTHTG